MVQALGSLGGRHLESSSVAVVGNYGVSFQCRANLPALLSAQRRELKSVLRSQGTNNFRRDRLFVGVGQWDFERNQLVQYQSFADERPYSTFAEIARPALQAKLIVVPLEKNPNPCLEQMPG